MKRGFASLAAVLAIALMVPLGAQAEPVSIECQDIADAAGTGSCSVYFELDDARFVSILGTHGNVHELGATASVTIQWIDADENLIKQFDCSGPGLPTPLDEQSLLCSDTGIEADSYVAGIQQLVVTLNSSTDCDACEFHGGFVFSEEGDLI